MRTRLFLGLFLAASSSTIFAMPYDTINHPGILEIALTGGGYKASTDNTSYGILASAFGLVGQTRFPTGSILKNDPEYKFGGSVLVGYYFPDSSLNVDISYFGARNNTNDFNSGNIIPSLLPPGYIAVVAGDPFAARAAESSFHFRYDYANIEVGSLTRVTCNGLIINPQLGLSYARLKGDQFVSYVGGNLPANLAGVAEQESSFNGFGPSIGFDLNYIFCQPVTLMGNFRYNALVGSVNSDYAFGGLTIGSPIISSVSNSSDDTLVSLIQAEIALGYDFSWTDAFCGNIAIGYQLTKAIGSAESWNYPDDVDASFFTSSMLNASLHGYFVRFTMDFPV